MDLHPAQKDSGPQADGENQVSVLQNGRAGAKERRAVPLCRRPPLLLHRLAGLSLTDVPRAEGNCEHLTDLPVPIRGRLQEAGVISSGGPGRLQSAGGTDVRGPPGGRGASRGAFTERFRGRSATAERPPNVPQGPGFTCDLHRRDCKHAGEMHLRQELMRALQRHAHDGKASED